MKYLLKTLIIGLIFMTTTDNANAATKEAISKGDTVKVNYTGTLQDGTKFDSSEGREPLQFTVGAGQVIPGFDKAVTGMKIGETKTFTIPVAEAYGPRDNERVLEVERSAIPAHVKLQVGEQIYGAGPDGQPIPFEVLEVSKDKVKLDANHPLAGKDLTFEISIVSIA
jgi:peptidylprolyl isomerase